MNEENKNKELNNITSDAAGVINTQVPQVSTLSNINNNGVGVNNRIESSVTPNISSIPIVQENVTQQVNNNINQNMVDEEELLKSFIGKNYEKISTRPFNFAAFFFTSFYFLYRKMFLYGLITFVVNLLISNYINFFVNNLVIFVIAFVMLSLTLSVLSGLFANKLYLHWSKKQVKKIKEQHINKDINEVKFICNVKGGTGFGHLILGIVIQFIIGLLISIIFMLIWSETRFNNFTFEVTNNSEPIEENATFEGIIMHDTSIKISDEFMILAPSIFMVDSDSYKYNFEYSSGQGVFNKCSAELYSPEGYSSGENLINQMMNYNKSSNPTTVTQITINNIKWYYFSYNNSFGTSYYYGTTKDNKAYIFSYEIQEDAADDCATYKEQILKTITAK